MQYGEEIDLKLIFLADRNKKCIKDFKSGNDEIDLFFKQKACFDRDCASFAFVDRSSKKAIAVYSLCCSGIAVSQNSQIYLYPAVEVKLFAVGEDYQHMPYSNEKGDGTLSDYLFDTVMYKIFRFTEKECGASRVVLYSVPKAVNFYKNKHGFSDFEKLMHPDDKRYIRGCVPLMRML